MVTAGKNFCILIDRFDRVPVSPEQAVISVGGDGVKDSKEACHPLRLDIFA